MKMYGDVEIKLHTLTLALDGGMWSALHSGCFNPKVRAQISPEEETGWAPEQVWISLTFTST
jgi:hypothetical protein